MIGLPVVFFLCRP